jgi:hypothetical protein
MFSVYQMSRALNIRLQIIFGVWSICSVYQLCRDRNITVLISVGDGSICRVYQLGFALNITVLIGIGDFPCLVIPDVLCSEHNSTDHFRRLFMFSVYQMSRALNIRFLIIFGFCSICSV